MPPKLQPGEGIVVVIDVGPKTRLGLPIEQTFFHQSMSCLINILQRKIFADKCRDRVGVILFGSDCTDNSSARASPGQYQHISVLQDLQLVDWGSIDKAKNIPRGSHDGDWVDAVVVALDMLQDNQNFPYSSKKIVLITDFSGHFTDQKIDQIISGMKSLHIDFNVIGPELAELETNDDIGEVTSGMSWSGKVKSKAQLAGEILISNVIDAVDGMLCSFDEAIPQLIFYQKKAVRSTNWNTLLEIGPDFQIPVTGKIKVKKATPNTWSRCHATDESIVITKERSYHKLDDEQTQVDDENVISGYRYGTTIVPFTDDDLQMSYSGGTDSSQLTVLGFTRSEHCSLQLRAGDQVMVISARDGDEDAAVALSAIIRALAELDMVGISRKVYRKNLNPALGALFPHITTQYECLIWVALPFQEDLRHLMFPSLRQYINNLTEDQNTVMDSLIDKLTLVEEDGQGSSEEILEPSSVLNPHLQHLFNCFTDRAVNPGRPLPAPHQHVTDILKVPAELRDNLEEIAGKVKKLFPTTRVVRQTKRERENIFGDEKNGENISKRCKDDKIPDIDNIQVDFGVSHITTASPLEDFVTLVRQQPQNFLTICDELAEILLQLMETLTPQESISNGPIINKIINCLVASRNDCLEISPFHYNSLIKKVKELVVGRGLLDTPLWQDIISKSLGLISVSETMRSEVTTDEAEKFLRGQEEVAPVEDVSEVALQQDNEDYDDLLDDL